MRITKRSKTIIFRKPIVNKPKDVKLTDRLAHIPWCKGNGIKIEVPPPLYNRFK